MMDVLEDEGRNEIPIFKNATSCLVTSHPETLLRVRDQGMTNSCVPHVVTACMYGEEVHRTGSSVVASPRELFDYMFFHKRPSKDQVKHPEGEFDVPEAGFTYNFGGVFSYVIDHGVSPLPFYKWKNVPSRFKTCSGMPWDGQIKNWGGTSIPSEQKIFIKRRMPVIPPGGEFDNMAVRGTKEYKQLNDVLDHQPLTGCIAATARLRYWNTDEIYKAIPNETSIGQHAITLVGYGREGDDEYFICQNSWGIDWVKQGYGRVLRKDVTRIYVPVDTHIPEERKKMNERKKRSVSLGEGNGPDDMGSALKKQK